MRFIISGSILLISTLTAVILRVQAPVGNSNNSSITVETKTHNTSCDPALTGVAKIVCLADEFKATLSASQLTTLELSYSLANAKQWSNLPTTFVSRLGLKFGDLNATQLAAVKALIQEISGTTVNEGYDEANQLWLADEYLKNNGGGNSYGEGLYYIAFLGTPSLTGLFEIQAGGHHLAIANTYNNGVMIGATPHFEATEPLTFTANSTSYSPLTQEKNAFVAMLAGLSSTELQTARLSTIFSDILLGPNSDWQFPTTKVGLRVGTLTTTQKNLVMDAIKTYVNDIDDTNAASIIAQYSAELDDTYIAYSGTTSLATQKDYVRIDGPSVWIEFVVQGGIVLSGVHYHSIWRDHVSDYGGTGSSNGTLTSVYTIPTNTIASLGQNYPNPASSETTIPFYLSEEANVHLGIYDINGHLVSEVVNEHLSVGDHRISVNLDNLAAGAYTYKIEAQNLSGIFKRAKVMVLR